MSVPQLPLALRYPPDQRFDGFVAAPAGLIAHLRAMAAGTVGDWLYLLGPAGSGKTHLALALCAETEQCGRRAAYLPLSAAAGRLSEALEALHDCDLIALDGLDRVVDAREDAIALFDFHNRARTAGRTVLYTAQAAPETLPVALPDLRSRLAQCARIALAALDDAGRAAVLRERAQRRGLVLEEAAIDWLLARSGRDLPGLLRLLEQLDRESLAAKRRVTVPFLRRVLEQRPH